MPDPNDGMHFHAALGWLLDEGGALKSRKGKN
jgi:hypothetical protein